MDHVVYGKNGGKTAGTQTGNGLQGEIQIVGGLLLGTESQLTAKLFQNGNGLSYNGMSSYHRQTEIFVSVVS